VTFHTPFDNPSQNSSTHQPQNDQPETLFDTAVQLTQNSISILPVGRDKLPYRSSRENLAIHGGDESRLLFFLG
jgi:hypothetical protein